jgi:hypothetical protein
MPSYSAGSAFITVAPNLRGFETKVSSYLKTHLKPVDVTVNADVDDGKAKTKLAAVSRDRTAKINADLDDRSARARLTALLRPRRMTVNVDADTSSAMARIAALRGGGGRIGGLIGAGLTGGALAGGPLGAPLLGGAAAGATAIAGAGGAGAIFGAALIGQITAMKKASKEMQTLGKHVDSLTKGTAEYRQQSKLLAAQQKDFTKQFGPASNALITLGSAWRGFLAGTRTQTMKVIVDALGIVSKLLPKLIPVANAAGKAIDGVLKLFGDFVNGPEGKQVLTFFQTFGATFITQFGKIGLNVLKGMFGLFIAFAPLTKTIGDGLVRASGAFADWSKNLGKTKGFQSFITYTKDNGPKVLSILGSLGKIFGKIVVAFAPLGGQILTVLAAFFKLLAKAPTPVVLAFALALVALISPAAAIVLAIGVIIVAFQHLFPTLRSIFKTGIRLLTGIWDTLWTGMKKLTKAGMDLLWKIVRNAAADIVDLFLGFAGTFLHLADKAFGWIPGIGGKLHTATKAFDKFRTDVNNAMRDIHDRHVKVDTTVSAARWSKVIAQLHGAAFATGGLVRGPGGPRDDAILARLSNREYVNTAATVSREGAHNFDLLNKGRATIVPRFASGGLVVSTAGTDASGAKDTARVADRITARIASLLGIGLVAAMDRIIHRLSAVTGGLHGRAIPIGHGYYRPISGPVTNGLHDSWTGFPALDFGGPVGRPVASVAPGRVAASYDIRGYEPRRRGAQDGYRSYGRVIQIRHRGFSTLYAHLSQRGVRTGQAVAGGTIIGLSGNTGYTTGPHLHFGSAGLSPWTFVGGATGGHTVFDGGGVARGAGYIPKRVIAPERVLTAQQTSSFDRLVGALDDRRSVGRHGSRIAIDFEGGRTLTGWIHEEIAAGASLANTVGRM